MIVKKYSDEELLFSAEARCQCGAGLAYPKNGEQPRDESLFNRASDWICSGVLKGEAPYDLNHDVWPFAFYEIKSENQPSANGKTTRKGITNGI